MVVGYSFFRSRVISVNAFIDSDESESFFVIAFERTIIGMWSGNEAFTFITIDEFFGMVGDINYYVCIGAKE